MLHFVSVFRLCELIAALHWFTCHRAGQDIKLEALQQVAGSSSDLRWQAQQFGTTLNRQMFTLQSKLMREAAKTFLNSERCANSSEALPQYLQGLGKSCGGWFFEEALWMAVYGTSCHVSSSSSWRRAAAAERLRRQQQRQQARQQREQARRQRREQERREEYEWARQQRRQQQYQQARQQSASMQTAPPDLAAAEPDVKHMSDIELAAFLQKVSGRGLLAVMAALFVAVALAYSALCKRARLQHVQSTIDSVASATADYNTCSQRTCFKYRVQPLYSIYLLSPGMHHVHTQSHVLTTTATCAFSLTLSFVMHCSWVCHMPQRQAAQQHYCSWHSAACLSGKPSVSCAAADTCRQAARQITHERQLHE
jgi:hypothetical protein